MSKSPRVENKSNILSVSIQLTGYLSHNLTFQAQNNYSSVFLLASLTTLVSFILITHVPTVIITITYPVSWDAPARITLELIIWARVLRVCWKEIRSSLGEKSGLLTEAGCSILATQLEEWSHTAREDLQCDVYQRPMVWGKSSPWAAQILITFADWDHNQFSLRDMVVK
jgi:hypothetical protein